eukprot:TRINITY_DN2446_c0_g1_i1.p1 TRINITY_DN2446_c0_g1~~TRINITY_DN2446_c0_g1_i1.p1  ORF type:complete len:281 (+),score=29.69 TRINITY_DN2446_c0_g1_i1:152-994(+)
MTHRMDPLIQIPTGDEPLIDTTITSHIEHKSSPVQPLQPQYLPFDDITPPTPHIFFALNGKTAHIAGNTITGVIVLVAPKDVQLKRVQILWEATEYSSWYQGTSMNVHCTSQRTIFSTPLSVWTPAEDRNALLKAGTHTFPFSWKLPPSIPGTFMDEIDEERLLPWVYAAKGSLLPRSLYGKKSSVTYTATCTVESDTGQLQSKIEFPVAEAFNTEVFNIQPITKAYDATSILQSDKIKLKATAGNIALVGYGIPIHLEVANGFSYSINAIKFSLVSPVL